MSWAEAWDGVERHVPSVQNSAVHAGSRVHNILVFRYMKIPQILRSRVRSRYLAPIFIDSLRPEFFFLSIAMEKLLFLISILLECMSANDVMIKKCLVMGLKWIPS